MKRIISLFLAVTLLISTLTVVSCLKLTAEDVDTTSITFDPIPSFYNSGALSAGVSIVTPSKYTNGNALKFTKLVNISTQKPQTAVISDNSGTKAFSVEPNVEYTIKIDVLNRVCTADYILGLVLLDDGYNVTNIPKVETLVSQEKFIDLYSFSSGNNKQSTLSLSFSAESKCKIGFVVYLKNKKSTDKSNQQIFIDNISIDPRVARTIVNNYDDSDVTFSVNNGMTYFSSVKSEQKDFTNSMAEIVTTEGPDGKTSNALHYFKAQNYNWQWPAIARIYDNEELTATFSPMADTAFEITFDYRVDKKPSTNLIFQIERVGYGVGNPNNGYSTDNIYCANVETITGKTDGWCKAHALFYTKDETPLTLTLVSASSALGSISVTDVDVYVDNIVVKERLDTYKLTLEPNNGEAKTTLRKLANEPITSLTAPTKKGCFFGGWYLDEGLTIGLSDTYLPTQKTTLYAKWIEKGTVFSDISYGFEESENIPFTNTSGKDSISDNYMTNNVSCNYDDVSGAYSGKGYLHFEPKGKSVGDNDDWMAFTLIDENGEPYQLSTGKRYELSYAYKYNSSLANTIALVTSKQIPSQGINVNNTTAILKNSTSGPDKPVANEWAEYKDYFCPEEDGIAKIVVYNCADGDTVDIDDLKLTVLDENECVVVNYYYVDQNGANKRIVNKRVGPSGTFMLDANNQTLNGYTFAGWVDDSGKQYLSSFFPKNDLDLFTSWKENVDISKATSDFSSDMLIDFDDSENAKPYYENPKNAYHAANGTYLVVGDSENAHSGSNYLMFKNCGHWMKEYYRQFKLYDKNSVGNQVYLEPNTAYKVSYWLNVESVDAANLFLVIFNGGTEEEREASGYVNTSDGKTGTNYYEVASENYLNEASVIEQIGKWVLVESTVVTGEDTDGDGVAGTLGFVLQGGYLTARIDDISIIKRKDIKVTFNTNGGSYIEPIEMLSYDTVICPEDPEKYGFTFGGWYTDEKLTEKYDFINTILTNDITLYASWNVKSEEKPKEVIIGYDTEESQVDIDTFDESLDGQISIGDNDKINTKKVKTSAEDVTNNTILYIIIGTVAFLLLAGTVVTVILIKKKRRIKNV